MSAVLAGTTLTWTGTFGEFSFYNQTSNDCTNNVASALRNKYNLIITRIADGIGSADFQAGNITLEVRTDMDRGNGSDGAADIKGNIDDEFALQGNAVMESIIGVSGGTTATVTVQTTSGGGGANYDSCTSFGDKIQNALPTWLGGSPVTANQQACYTQQNQAQIKSVATNAAAAYGPDSKTAQVAKDTADKQAILSAKDTQILADKARADAAAHDEAQKNMLITAGIIVAVIIGALIILPYTRPA
jgi:hypothetical protein